MRLRPLGLLLTLGLLVAGTANAQQTSQEITFDEALRIGLERNTALRQAVTAAEARALDVTLNRAEFLPDVSASVRPVQNYGLIFDQTTGQLEQETTEQLNASVSANLNLFNGFRDQASLRQARLQREASEFSLDRSRQDVLFNVANQFLQVLLSRELVAIQEENLAADQAQLEQIGQLVEGGVRARADALQQEAQVAQRELSLLQAEADLELAKTRLVQVLQLDPFGNYTFVAPSFGAVPLQPDAIDLEEILTAALDRREDLRAQELQIDAAEADIRVARGGYYPTVNLFASYGSGYSSLATRSVGEAPEIPVTTGSGDIVLVGGEPLTFDGPAPREDTPFGDQFFTDNRGGSVGLSVNIPIFDRLATRSQVQQAKIRAENERIALDNLRQEVALQVRQGWLDYQNAAKRLDVTARQVASAEAALEAEQERYDLGVSTLTELTQARATLVEAQSNRAQAVSQFVFQRTLLDYAVGTLDPSARLFD
ncbi:MAG: TolC family protein [Bacteroidota bacterium]